MKNVNILFFKYLLFVTHLISSQTLLGQSYPTWTQVHSLVINGATLEKGNSQTAWNSGAISTEYSDGDGWIEFRFDTRKYSMMGLSQYNTTPNATFDYGIFSHITNKVIVREHGVYVNIPGTTARLEITYVLSDVFRVERLGSVVYYKKNGQTFYTSSIPSTGPIYADCAFNLFNQRSL